MVKRTLAVMGLILGLGATAATPAGAASLGTGVGAIRPDAGSHLVQIGCWNCGWGGGVVVGTGFAPVFAPAYAPGVVFAVPQMVVPQVVVQPVIVPQVFVQPVVVQPVIVQQAVVPVVPVLVPASCWHETDNRGFGFWGSCWAR